MECENNFFDEEECDKKSIFRKDIENGMYLCRKHYVAAKDLCTVETIGVPVKAFSFSEFCDEMDKHYKGV